MQNKVIGLDLSLTHSGIVVMGGTDVYYHGVVKSKPNGDTYTDELVRIIGIVSSIQNIIQKHTPTIALIENLAFGIQKTTSLTQLAGLSFLVRLMLYKNGVHFCMVSPGSLKKFVTGKGNADKNIIMMEIYKQYGHSALDDNEADAYGLAVLGHAIMGKSINKLTKPQQEVVDLVKTQLC